MQPLSSQQPPSNKEHLNKGGACSDPVVCAKVLNEDISTQNTQSLMVNLNGENDKKTFPKNALLIASENISSISNR